MPTLRLAILGAGIFVRDTYLPNIEATRGRCKLTAMLSRSAESVDEALALLSDGGDDVARFVGSEGEARFFASARDLCDAVIIVVPIPLLGGYVEKCLSLGLHILSEKPVAVTSDEATRLINLYRQPGRPSGSGLWHVAENYRLEPSVLYARDVVASKSPLRPKTFALTCIRQQSPTSKYAVTAWRAQPSYRGSYVLDGGIHFIALLREVLGVDSISDIRAHYEESSAVEVGTCGSCRAGDAVGPVHIRYGAFVAPVCRLDVFFEDATLSIIQHKAEGYEVLMTGREPRRFAFEGLQREWDLWLDTMDGAGAGVEAGALSPEQGLTDLKIVEALVGPAA